MNNYSQKTTENFYKILNYFDDVKPHQTSASPRDYGLSSNTKGTFSKKMIELKSQLVDPQKIVTEVKLKYQAKEKLKKNAVENIGNLTNQDVEVNLFSPPKIRNQIKLKKAIIEKVNSKVFLNE
jgi:predicted transport protein